MNTKIEGESSNTLDPKSILNDTIKYMKYLYGQVIGSKGPESKKSEQKHTYTSINQQEIDPRNRKIEKSIKEKFREFVGELEENGNSEYQLRQKRNISIELIRGKEVVLSSYGEKSKVDLETRDVYYQKGGEEWVKIEEQGLDSIEKIREILITSTEDFSHLYLKIIFGRMNVINRIMSMSDKKGNNSFYFENFVLGNVKALLSSGGNDYTSILKINGENVLSIGGLKKWFGFKDEEKFKKEFLNMLNNLDKNPIN